jgi:ketosteroid isomerase-like protein
MTQPNEDVVRAASAAFGRGDLGALRDQFFAPDIVWHIAGTGPLAGDYATRTFSPADQGAVR